MNALIEENYIKEMECGSNFSYILNDNSVFLATEYKVLQSQTNSCFVKCMKNMYNGKTQLYYLTSGFKSLSSVIYNVDSESFLTIVANLFSDIIDVKHNGFLSCQNIVIDFNRIYIDPNTLKVNLVYLPLNKRLFDDSLSFENELRTELVKLISSCTNLASPKTAKLSADLCNGSLSLEDLSEKIRGGKSLEPTMPINDEQNDDDVCMSIIAMNAPTRIEMSITKDEFVIGKKPDLCDGILDFNKMISRVHCRINKNGSQYTITDLQSANGTFVNKVKLQPNQSCAIKNGDIIRLANSDFQVSVR